MTNSNKEASDDEILKQLECPFTWDMEAIANYDRAEKQYHENDDEEFLPLLKLMRKIMTVYVYTNVDEDRTKILEILKKCDKDIEELEESANREISIDVVQYVLQATQCFVYQKYEMKEELKQTLAKVKGVNFSSEKDQSTLKACRSIGWSKYHRVGSIEAEKFIREAIAKNPKCDLWYFILAKNLRRQRRDISITTKPSREEIDNFLKAYNTSRNLVYEVFLAQMYREMRNKNEAKKFYERVFHRNPESTTLLLRLSLGFIRLWDFQKARVCLDKVGKNFPNNNVYLHYYGTYYMKQKNYQKAINYFEKAIEDYNISAEKEYLVCLLKINRNFAITEYLVNMLEKYKDLPENQLQNIILDLGLCYWRKKNNLTEAVNYLLRAVEINPKANCFKNYYDYINFNVENVYGELAKRFLPTIFKDKSKFSKEMIEKAEKLKNHCDNSLRYSNDFRNMENAFRQVRL